MMWVSIAVVLLALLELLLTVNDGQVRLTCPARFETVVFTDETSGHCSGDIIGVVSYRFQFVF